MNDLAMSVLAAAADDPDFPPVAEAGRWKDSMPTDGWWSNARLLPNTPRSDFPAPEGRRAAHQSDAPVREETSDCAIGLCVRERSSRPRLRLRALKARQDRLVGLLGAAARELRRGSR